VITVADSIDKELRNRRRHRERDGAAGSLGPSSGNLKLFSVNLWSLFHVPPGICQYDLMAIRERIREVGIKRRPASRGNAGRADNRRVHARAGGGALGPLPGVRDPAERPMRP
jgi:hypothetical protein